MAWNTRSFEKKSRHSPGLRKSFTGFALNNRLLTTAECDAIATVVRTLGGIQDPPADHPPVATTIFNFPPIE